MNIKSLMLVLLCIFTIFTMLSSVNAFSIEKSDKDTIEYINGKSIISTVIISDDRISDSKMKNDLNRIDKIVVKVDNKEINVIKKGKGWNKYKSYPTSIIDRKTIVKGKIKGKNVTIITYTKSNKIIKKSTNKVSSFYAKNSKNLIKSKHPPYAELNYNQALKRANKNLPKNNNAVYKGYYYIGGDLFWAFNIYKKNVVVSELSIDDQTNTIGFGSIE